MNDANYLHRTTRTVRARYREPRTWGGLALYLGFAALVPLTLFALAHPTVVAAAVAGLSAGLLARPLRDKLSRDSGRTSPSSNAVGPAAARD